MTRINVCKHNFLARSCETCLLEQENKELREALEFYASVSNWTEGDLHRVDYPEVLVSVIEKDGGHKARQVLGSDL